MVKIVNPNNRRWVTISPLRSNIRTIVVVGFFLNLRLVLPFLPKVAFIIEFSFLRMPTVVDQPNCSKRLLFLNLRRVLPSLLEVAFIVEFSLRMPTVVDLPNSSKKVIIYRDFLLSIALVSTSIILGYQRDNSILGKIVRFIQPGCKIRIIWSIVTI